MANLFGLIRTVKALIIVVMSFDTRARYLT
jgi:hypothetical protein